MGEKKHMQARSTPAIETKERGSAEKRGRGGSGGRENIRQKVDADGWRGLSQHGRTSGFEMISPQKNETISTGMHARSI